MRIFGEQEIPEVNYNGLNRVAQRLIKKQGRCTPGREVERVAGETSNPK